MRKKMGILKNAVNEKLEKSSKKASNPSPEDDAINADFSSKE